MKWQRPRLPQQARPLRSLFPVCLPGKDHVTSPEGNADIIVSLTHVRPPSLPPSLPARRHSDIHRPASLHHPASSPTTHACSHLFLCLPCATLSFVFFFLVGCLLDCLGHTHTHTSGALFLSLLQQAFSPLSFSRRSVATESSLWFKNTLPLSL